MNDQIAILNMQAYVDAETEAVFYGKTLWISSPNISHSICDFRNQPKMNDKADLKSRVMLQVRMMTFTAFSFFTKFGQNLVNSFRIDLYGNRAAFRTVSVLAFESVWTHFALWEVLLFRVLKELSLTTSRCCGCLCGEESCLALKSM